MQLETWSCPPLCLEREDAEGWLWSPCRFRSRSRRGMSIQPPSVAGVRCSRGARVARVLHVGEQRGRCCSVIVSRPPRPPAGRRSLPIELVDYDLREVLDGHLVPRVCGGRHPPGGHRAQRGDSGAADPSPLRARAVVSKGARPVSVGVVPMTTSTCVGWRCRRRTRCGSGSPRERLLVKPTPQSVAVETRRRLACSGDLPWASPSSCC